MKEQIVIQKLLQKKLAEAQSANPQYSLRAFSKKIGINPGAISSILNGKRNVSSKLVERIADRLMLDPQERAELYTHFRVLRYTTPTTNTVEETAEYRKLTVAQFKVTSEWEHFAVLSLMRTKAFKSDAAWIANRLGITATRARDVVARLVDAQMVAMDTDGNLKRTAPRFRTTDDVADVSLRKSHVQSLELAKRSLEQDDVLERDHTWMAFAMDPKNISIAKEKIRQFQDELLELVEVGNQTEVYRFSMHLYPLTKTK